MNDAFRHKKEGQRRALAQLLLPWVDEMPDTYTPGVGIVNTQRWVFDGYLMGSRKTGCAGAVNRAESPVNKGRRVFDGYLMGSGFASGQSNPMPLNKMKSNQPNFVKSHVRQKRKERRESLIFKGFPFDTETGESTAVCSLNWSIKPA